jgi:acetolactate decarboxylase
LDAIGTCEQRPGAFHWIHDPGPSFQAMASNQIYQYSVISALMTGLSSASSSTTVSKLLAHGTLGLGTFESMDGEMVILDGQAYQLKHDGSVAKVAGSAKIPFGSVTQFEPQTTRKSSLRDKDHLTELVADMFPHARNHFVALRVDGYFDYVKCRTIPPQTYEGEPLTEVGKRQTVKEYHDVKGTIVGFRSPQWSEGVSVVGIHVHFLSAERSFGGHVLAVRADSEVEVGVSACINLHIDLPHSEEFGARNLEDDAEGLKNVEG